MGRPSKGSDRLTAVAAPSITLPRAFCLDILVRSAVPVLQDEVAQEELVMYAVDSGAAGCKTPEAALRCLLSFWLSGARPEDP